MMSLPQAFLSAGMIPTTLVIFVVCTCTSLTASMFSEIISGLPGNFSYNLNIEYSSVFKILLGHNVYVATEVLFITACLMQCCIGIAQAAQSFDSFIASFILGKVYGLQLYPNIEWVTWSSSTCVQLFTDTAVTITAKDNDGDDEFSDLSNCIPFQDNGFAMITMGYIFVMFFFLPLGIFNLKETMIVQIVSFLLLCIIMTQFNIEFAHQGFDQPIPLFGGDYKHLVGVVLFNYAYLVTIPTWLIEKRPEVNPHRVIWITSIFCGVLYITFGLLGAATYGVASSKMLTILASSEVSKYYRYNVYMNLLFGDVNHTLTL
jgi:hypothetical protein